MRIFSKNKKTNKGKKQHKLESTHQQTDQQKKHQITEKIIIYLLNVVTELMTLGYSLTHELLMSNMQSYHS